MYNRANACQSDGKVASMVNELNDQHWIETYKSLIALSIEGFKFSALANGGAAVALLAYLGNVAGKGSHIPDMRCAMAAFLGGLAICGFAMLCAYITQLKLLNERHEDERKGGRHSFSHSLLLWLTMILYACSLISFGLGSWQAIISFK
jgi:hypothetical protein